MNPGFNSSHLKQISVNLARRNIQAICVDSRSDALEQAIRLIPSGAKVTQGGSVTLDQIGLRDHLISEIGFTFLDPYAPDLSAADRLDRRRQGLLCDVFFCSTNALTLDGILINRDGIGNRVSAMTFGPRKVIIIAGINKVVTDIQAGIERINNLAAPLNAGRLKRSTPCIQSGKCSDCRCPERICATTVCIEWQVDPTRMTVILVPESLGL